MRMAVVTLMLVAFLLGIAVDAKIGQARAQAARWDKCAAALAISEQTLHYFSTHSGSWILDDSGNRQMITALLASIASSSAYIAHGCDK